VWGRRVVGWVMATHLRTEFVLGALEMAIVQGRPKGVDPSQRPGLLVHLDRVRSTLRTVGRAALDGIRHSR
jgi:hypothetical protein